MGSSLHNYTTGDKKETMKTYLIMTKILSSLCLNQLMK